jgi:hypothetical protein
MNKKSILIEEVNFGEVSKTPDAQINGGYLCGLFCSVGASCGLWCVGTGYDCGFGCGE